MVETREGREFLDSKIAAKVNLVSIKIEKFMVSSIGGDISISQ